MSLTPFLELGRNFISLPPSVPQIANLLRYSTHFFLKSFPVNIGYDPLSIGIHIIYTCNLKCPNCWNTTINKQEYKQEAITPDEYEKIITHPRLKNAFRVSFVGGEPLLHPSIFQFIALARKNRKLTMFPTNGLLIEKRLNEFKTTPLTSIQISLYDGHVEEQLRNASLLRKTNQRIQVALARYVTAESESLHYMDEVVKMASSLGIKNICFQNFQPPPGGDASRCIYDDNQEVLAFLRGFQQRHSRRFNIMLPIPLIRDVSKRFCYDLHTVIFVGKDGSIAPCSTIVPPNRKYGSIWEPDFWNNRYFIAHRANYNTHFPFAPDCEHCYESSSHMRHFI